MSRVALSRVLNGHAGVSAVLLLALERIGWSDAEHWMRMLARHAMRTPAVSGTGPAKGGVKARARAGRQPPR